MLQNHRYFVKVSINFRGSDLRDPRNFAYFVRVYRNVQTLLGTHNSSFYAGRFMPGACVIVYVGFIVAVNISVRHTATPVFVAAAFCYSIFCVGLWLYPIVLFWKITEGSESLVGEAKSHTRGKL